MGKITVVGVGPGSLDFIPLKARQAIDEAEVIVGYTPYIKSIKELLTSQIVIDTGMTQEIDRVKTALQHAADGKKVAIVSSGDAGVYGMAGLVLELLLKIDEENRPQFGGVVVGISAVNAAAAVLGAPLMHDFAVISLSDLLTPWETIAKRIEFAVAGDFVIAFYNPKSKKRVRNIETAREIMLKSKSPSTPVGIVTSAGKDDERRIISDLANFLNEEITMSSLVIVGNSQTYVKDGWMITPRGYENKEPRA